MVYGIPLEITGSERNGSVDSALTLLFSDALASSPTLVDPNKSWGVTPIGSWGAVGDSNSGFEVTNPYHRGYSDSSGLPVDFGLFRTSTKNDEHPTVPSFTIVRQFDDTHAVAAGKEGILYTGIESGGSWAWSPVCDPNKGFICTRVNDICVTGQNTACACTEYGTWLSTSNAGQTWTATALPDAVISYAADLAIRSLSVYDSQGDWWALADYVGQSNSYSLRRSDNPGYQISLPQNFAPAYVAAADANTLWVSGSSGIYYTTNSGGSWTPVYSGGAVGQIWVNNGAGWAIGPNNTVLQTSDGTNWSAAYTLPGSASDLAVYDAAHLAVACGSQGYCIYNDGAWFAEPVGPAGAPASVSWAGVSNLVCVSGSNIQPAAIDSAGTVGWGQQFTPPVMHWRCRYLTSRIDGYSYPTDSAGRPTDVMALISRGAATDSAGRAGALQGEWVLNDCPPASNVDRTFSDDFISALENTGVADSSVCHEIYVDSAGWSGHTFITSAGGLPGVIGYSSSESYDCASYEDTTWFRPGNTWAPGAAAITNLVSTDGRTLRVPDFISILPDTAGNAQANKLTVFMWPQTEWDVLSTGEITFNCSLYWGTR